MESKIASSIGLQAHPVAIVWAEEAPQGAAQFKPQSWGCVMGLMAAAAPKDGLAFSTGRAMAAGAVE